MFWWEVSTKLHDRYKCHIWIQYRLYITILMLLIYIHNLSIMFHLHPQSWNNRLETFHLPISLKLCKCSQISCPSPRVESTPNRKKTNHHWLNNLQPIHTTLNYATSLTVGLRGSSHTLGVTQENPSSFP